MVNTRAKIMIVDDVIANLTATRNLLKSHHEIYLATSAAQMFEILEKIKPDLILLDIEMPVMNGYEALEHLKRDERYAGIPVIFLTARNDEAGELRGFDLGAADYIDKPFSRTRLLRRIEQQLVIARQRKTIQNHADTLAGIVSEKNTELSSLQSAICAALDDFVEILGQ